MAYRSREEMEARLARLRELADGTRTRMEVAKEMGLDSDILGRWAQTNAPDVRFLPSGMGRPVSRNKVTKSCASPVKDEACGTCAYCVLKDQEEAVHVPRCKCGLALPCYECIGTIEDYIYRQGYHELNRGNGMKGKRNGE